MITKLELRNFKCFKNHEVPLKNISILVGRNNAGKSTLVEALRLVSLITEKCKISRYHAAPNWCAISSTTQGISPSLEGLKIDLDNVFYQYGDPPALIRATFSNRCIVEIHIGPSWQIFGVIRDRTGRSALNRNSANNLHISPVAILPQISPLLRNEKILIKQYVLQTMSTYLTSLHFRNELKYQYQYFDKFKNIAEQTWHGLEVRELEGFSSEYNDPLGLIVRDGNFAAEIGWMGHGLQMWLQVMWFLARVTKEHTIILDEPDVYMHADLQRKLIRQLQITCKQTIIATHSIEIMSEVEPENILVVDHKSPKSDFASSLPAVQQIIDRIGGVHNLHLSRLWNSKKCLFIEGDDLELMHYFQDVLFPHTSEPIRSFPHVSVGGWGGWNYAIGSSMLLRNAFGQRICVYSIFDRDYHTEEEINARYKQAKDREIYLHIWEKKELENYLLIPSACTFLKNDHINTPVRAVV
jgi:predicted ATPase